MLPCSRQTLPKIAMVFDEDVDIGTTRRSFRRNHSASMRRAMRSVPGQPGIGIDPTTGRDQPPYVISKLGMDCMIPWGDGWIRENFAFSLNANLGEPDPKAKLMTEDEIATDMEAFIKAKPRSWKDIITNYLAQPYPLVYRAFGRLRPRLGRVNANPWFPYTFSGHEFDAVPDPAPQHNFDPKHPKA